MANKKKKAALAKLKANSRYGKKQSARDAEWSMLEETAAVAIETGMKLGYPPCCVAQFIVDSMLLQVDSNYEKSTLRSNASVYGFVPCETHARLLLDKQVTHKELLVNRSKDVKPWPMADIYLENKQPILNGRWPHEDPDPKGRGLKTVFIGKDEYHPSHPVAIAFLKANS